MSKANHAALREKVEKQFQQFTEQLFSDGGNIDKLLRSGAIDLSEPEEGFVTSSRIMCALGRHMEDQYTPSGDQRTHKREVKNIEIHL